MRTIKLKKCARIHALYFASDGARLLVVGGPTAYISNAGISVDVFTGAEIDRAEFPQPTCYNVDPAITRLVLGGHAGYAGGIAPVRWIEVPHGTEWHEIPFGGVNRVCDVAFDGSGELLAVTSATYAPRRRREQCKVDLFRFAPNKTPKHLASMPTQKPAGAIAFSADSKRLAVGAGLGGTDAFEVFDIKSAKRVFRFDPQVPDRRCVQFLPDGRVAAAAGSKVYILPPKGGKPQFELGTSKALVNDLAATADGRRLVAGLNNGAIQVWDTTTGQPGPTFNWRVGGVWSVALAPDGLTCAAAGSQGRIVIWDVDA
jgi:WD40 repeat protein